MLLAYLLLTYLSLTVAAYLWKRNAVTAIIAPPVLMVPLFYLVYTGAMFLHLSVALNLLAPAAWAHAALYAWHRQKRAVAITYALSTPALFLLVHGGAFIHARYLVPLTIWALFFTGLIGWNYSKAGTVK